MAHIVGVCELGGYLGHVTKLLNLLKPFAEAGHQCTLIFPDLQHTAIIEHCGFQLQFIQGPRLNVPGFTSSRPAMSFSEVLLCAGLGTEQIFRPQVLAWRQLFNLLQPALVLLDYAPTALLACSGLPCQKITLGTAFSLPPPINPLPQFNRSIAIKPQHLQAADNQLLNTWNAWLSEYNLPPLSSVSALFLQYPAIIVDIPQVDFYRAQRQTQRYLIMAQSTSPNAPPAWSRSHSGTKIFAYLKTEYAQAAALLTALRQQPVNICAFISGPGAEDFLSLAADNLSISLTPLDMQAVTEQAQWLIYHAGCGTATQALRAGKGSILIPTYYEQLLTAQALETQGLGVIINPNWTSAEAETTLIRALQNTDILARCQTIQHQLAQHDYGIEAFVEDCEKLLS